MGDGWELATHWRKQSRALPSARTRRRAEEQAIAEVLARARRLMRHTSRPRDALSAIWPAPGELDVEETLAQLPVRASGLQVFSYEPRSQPVMLMLDMSLSMSGEKIALMAVAAAILQLALGRAGVVAFDSRAKELASLDLDVPPPELVRRVLSFPAEGFTNITVGLETGLLGLRQIPAGQGVGVLLTDGIANVGGDPTTTARRFGRLHVVRLGKPTAVGTLTARRLATAGRGRVWEARRWEAMPGVVRELVRAVFRR